jgi:hypothetical protein
LGLFPLHLSQICKGFVILVYFFKEPAFLFHLFFVFFLTWSLFH